MKKLLFFVIALFTLSACEDNFLHEKDGDWDEMKWEKTSYHTIREEGQKTTYYRVPAEGATFIFKCKNYKGIWLSDCAFEQNGKIWHSYETLDTGEQIDFHHYQNDWCEVTAEENTLTITFFANTSTSRKASIGVTAGDIFDTFMFWQDTALYTTDNQ